MLECCRRFLTAVAGGLLCRSPTWSYLCSLNEYQLVFPAWRAAVATTPLLLTNVGQETVVERFQEWKGSRSAVFPALNPLQTLARTEASLVKVLLIPVWEGAEAGIVSSQSLSVWNLSLVFRFLGDSLLIKTHSSQTNLLLARDKLQIPGNLLKVPGRGPLINSYAWGWNCCGKF